MIKPSRTERFVRVAAQVIFVFCVAGVMTFACAEGIAKQVEVEENKVSDYCRAHPAECDMPERRL